MSVVDSPRGPSHGLRPVVGDHVAPGEPVQQQLPRIRNAHIDDAPLLTTLARLAKAQWRYSPADMMGWAASLQVTEESIHRCPTCVSEVDGHPVGFYQLNCVDAKFELDHLWVHPACMRRGIGRQLLTHAIDTATHLGAATLRIDADPNAEAFYLRCGAIRVGAISAPIDGQPLRVRPQLLIQLSPGKTPAPSPSFDKTV